MLERLPYKPGDPSIRELRSQRNVLTSNPDNTALAAEVAITYINRGRATGDPRYYGYAQAALEPWWDTGNAPAGILVLRADIKQASHDFNGALTDLGSAIEKEPDNINAILTRAIILQVQGRYKAARRDCARLLEAARRAPSIQLTATTCAASVASFNGHAARSWRILRDALKRSVGAGTQGMDWALTTLADIAARLGRVHAAKRYFQAALAMDESAWLSAAHADFLLQQGRPQQVIELLGGEPGADTLLLLLTLAEQKVDAPRLDEHITLLRDRFAASRQRGDQRHLREEARFTLHLLDQPKAALRLARANWQTQREPEDARIFLQAALAAGRPKAARPVLGFLNRSGLEDKRLERLSEHARMAIAQ
ncbi:MAG: tetratricopeptide repeat protein [Gammaproteobacteria bacterium]